MRGWSVHAFDVSVAVQWSLVHIEPCSPCSSREEETETETETEHGLARSGIGNKAKFIAGFWVWERNPTCSARESTESRDRPRWCSRANPFDLHEDMRCGFWLEWFFLHWAVGQKWKCSMVFFSYIGQWKRIQELGPAANGKEKEKENDKELA